MYGRLKLVLLVLVLFASLAAAGCVSCIPQYTAPPDGPVSAKYPAGHDPYVPLDHNISPWNPWDVLSSVASPLLYGPPR
ncbi:hypothetical protein [Desulfomonile tiedjei]|uniref:Lipoprotein n=1 Tax=Desulfomonile tiedjei (strain ATCC 49306 / DSM 6799 / DCB-1) TaxID=706587 RepID=I4CDF9_DESTA|nr:hypothetical protein [Desulfomonile tiedjei]AFM27600.1 hypothetical protein Desti_4988 [Desulfomonile tiedjei DSM 6799]